MTQKFYLHDAATTDTGTLPGASTLSAATPSPTASGAATNRSMTGTIGTSQVSVTAGPSLSSSDNCWLRRFCSTPLTAQTIASGTWTWREAGSTNDSLTNVQPGNGFVIVLWRPSSGTKITTIFDGPHSSAPGSGFFGTTQTDSGVPSSGNGTSVTGSAFTSVAGDILVCEVWFQTSNTSTGDTATLYYDGTTEGSTSSNAAYLNAPVNIVLQPVGGGILDGNKGGNQYGNHGNQAN